MITIDSSLTDLKGVGPKRAEALGRLGLFSVRDLLYFSQREHYDLREAKKIGELCHGEYAIVKIEEIEKPKVSYPVMRGRRTPLVTVVVSDGTGKLRLSWFNQPYIRNSIPEFAHGFVHGRVDLSNGRRMINAAFCPAPKEKQGRQDQEHQGNDHDPDGQFDPVFVHTGKGNEGHEDEYSDQGDDLPDVLPCDQIPK